MKWEIQEIDQFKVDNLSNTLGITSPVAHVVISRGYEDVEDARRFLYPQIEHLMDPFDFPDMRQGVDRILHAIQRKEHILVFGHNDVDGLTATALLIKAIRDLGGIVDWYIPRDKTVGLNPQLIKDIRSKNITLIITVDCICSIPNLPNEIDIIITDHHEFPKGRPASFAFINPKFGYSFPCLAGVGVAYKLAQALAMQKLKITPYQWFSASCKLLPLVLLGTIADRVELVSENRAFVKLSKEAINGSVFDKIGINESIKLLGSAKTNPNVGIEFLLTDFSIDEITSPLLSELEKARIEQDTEIESAYRLCVKIKSLHSGIILAYADELDPNTIGVCASKLMSREHLPSVVIGKSVDGILVGDGRAPDWFNLIELFKQFDDIFIDWGGHKGAAGFSMYLSKVAEFKVRLGSFNFTPPEKVLKIDGEIKPTEITLDFLGEIELLEPFGVGNLAPLFLMQGMTLEEISEFTDFPCCRKSGMVTSQDGKFDVVCGINQGRIEIKDWRENEYSTC